MTGRYEMADKRHSHRADKQAHMSSEQAEAHRILERVQREATASIVQRSFARTTRHLSAEDVNETDAVEVWSTRIGRWLGTIITLAIIVWLIFYLLQG